MSALKKTATKAQLRQEIAELRYVGHQMANICFNLGQSHSRLRARAVDRRDEIVGWADSMYRLRKEWDAIKRRESSETAAARSRAQAAADKEAL